MEQKVWQVRLMTLLQDIYMRDGRPRRNFWMSAGVAGAMDNIMICGSMILH